MNYVRSLRLSLLLLLPLCFGCAPNRVVCERASLPVELNPPWLVELEKVHSGCLQETLDSTSGPNCKRQSELLMSLPSMPTRPGTGQ